MGLNIPPTLAARLPLFPTTTHLDETGDGRLTIAGLDLAELARQYGTPLYVYDRASLDATLARYQAALQTHYPGESGITYAGKAFLCLGIAQWTQQHGLWLDCTGAGELAVAFAAGVPRPKVLVHGVNKNQADLSAALQHAGTLVVDNLGELERLAALASTQTGPLPDVWLRLRPGMAVQTHAHTQTGQEDSKFGFGPAELLQAVGLCLRHDLPLTGLHFHQGSHFHDPAPLAPALDIALDLIEEAQSTYRWTPQVLSPGGGWGVPYHEDDLPHLPLETYVQFIAEHLVAGCQQRRVPLPRLHLEPGRSLVAQAGVALYQVGSVKHTLNRRWLLLDGGLADNPRPALYQARYSALPIAGLARPVSGPAWLGGPFCESGDVLISGLPLPEIQPGETIAVPVSGAYQISMSSNYNGARKPAVLWLEDGRASLLQRRQVPEDLYSRDLPLPPGA
ncbi:MAG: diaminopimelate decarboxylase [Chloroflexota bacterium]